MPEEMTNQFDEGTSSDDFSIDEIAEETTEAEDTTEESTTTAEEPFMSIRYNGADENLTREQAIELAQKGKNYDKIYNRLNELQNDPIRRMITEQAKNAGLTVEEYTNRLAQFQETSAINRIARDFMAKNPGITDEVAQQYAQQAYKNQLAERQAQQAQAEQQVTQSRQATARQQVEQFMREFPNVDIQTLPQEVVEDIDNNGETLLSAYRAYENRQLRKELEAARHNSSVKAKSIGDITHSNSSKVEADPFLAGLLGE